MEAEWKYNKFSIIIIFLCEEEWEKGPIVSEYCFEKNAFKVSQIFRRHGKRDIYSTQVLFYLNC